MFHIWTKTSYAPIHYKYTIILLNWNNFVVPSCKQIYSNRTCALTVLSALSFLLDSQTIRGVHLCLSGRLRFHYHTRDRFTWFLLFLLDSQKNDSRLFRMRNVVSTACLAEVCYFCNCGSNGPKCVCKPDNMRLKAMVAVKLLHKRSLRIKISLANKHVLRCRVRYLLYEWYNMKCLVWILQPTVIVIPLKRDILLRQMFPLVEVYYPPTNCTGLIASLFVFLVAYRWRGLTSLTLSIKSKGKALSWLEVENALSQFVVSRLASVNFLAPPISRLSPSLNE